MFFIFHVVLMQLQHLMRKMDSFVIEAYECLFVVALLPSLLLYGWLSPGVPDTLVSH